MAQNDDIIILLFEKTLPTTNIPKPQIPLGNLEGLPKKIMDEYKHEAKKYLSNVVTCSGAISVPSLVFLCDVYDKKLQKQMKKI